MRHALLPCYDYFFTGGERQVEDGRNITLNVTHNILILFEIIWMIRLWNVGHHSDRHQIWKGYGFLNQAVGER